MAVTNSESEIMPGTGNPGNHLYIYISTLCKMGRLYLHICVSMYTYMYLYATTVKEKEAMNLGKDKEVLGRG